MKKIPPKDRQALRKKAEKGDERAAAKLAEIVQPNSPTLFDAILALNKTRNSIGGEPQPIQYSEMIAYANANGFDNSMLSRLQNVLRYAEEFFLNGDDKT